MNILLSRTDNIGDVIFTLPMAGFIKKYYPNSKVYFLGKSYTRALVECCSFIDGFYDWDEIQKASNPIAEFKKLSIQAIIHVFPNKKIAHLAKKADIKIRIGTNRRFFHWFTCSKLINLSRKHSVLHEAQLNLQLLKSFKIPTKVCLEDIPQYYGLTQPVPYEPQFAPLIDNTKFNLIFHPKSKGSAREWDASSYVQLYHLLPKEKFNIFITGIKEEEKELQEKIISHCPEIKNVVGLFTLSQFISFIHQCDGLLACSTGPLHIASALGKYALGLYPPIQSMLPKRWGALGKYAHNLTGIPPQSFKKKRILCSKKRCERQTSCQCIQTLSPQKILEIIVTWKKENDDG